MKDFRLMCCVHIPDNTLIVMLCPPCRCCRIPTNFYFIGYLRTYLLFRENLLKSIENLNISMYDSNRRKEKKQLKQTIEEKKKGVLLISYFR